MDESNLLKNLIEFNERSRPKQQAESQDEKISTFKSVNAFYEVQ